MTKFFMLVGSIYLATVMTAWAADKPCKPIAEACMKAGYTQGGHSTGKGLMQDCLKPIIDGKTVANVTVDDAVLKACQAKAAEKEAAETNKS